MSEDTEKESEEKDFDPADLKKKSIFDLPDDDDIGTDPLLPIEDEDDNSLAQYEADDESRESYSY